MVVSRDLDGGLEPQVEYEDRLAVSGDASMEVRRALTLRRRWRRYGRDAAYVQMLPTGDGGRCIPRYRVERGLVHSILV